jgi:hypothetical protein
MLHRSRGECEARSKNAHAGRYGAYMACGRTQTARAKLDEFQARRTPSARLPGRQKRS